MDFDYGVYSSYYRNSENFIPTVVNTDLNTSIYHFEILKHEKSWFSSEE